MNRKRAGTNYCQSVQLIHLLADILDVYRLSLAHGLSLASDLWDLVIKNFHKFIHNHNHLKMTEVELMKALNDTRLAIDTKYEMLIAEGYVMVSQENITEWKTIADWQCRNT